MSSATKVEKKILPEEKSQNVKPVKSLVGSVIADKRFDGAVKEKCQRIRNENTPNVKVRKQGVKTKFHLQIFDNGLADVHLCATERRLVAAKNTDHKIKISPKSLTPKIPPKQTTYSSRPSYLSGSDDKRKMKMSTLKNTGITTNERRVNAVVSRKVKSIVNASVGEDSPIKDNQVSLNLYYYHYSLIKNCGRVICNCEC